MKQSLSAEVLKRLAGKKLATAESITGGGIGQAVTSVSGASAVFVGGIISYTNEVKHDLLDVPTEVLDRFGAVSGPVAKAMAVGARKALKADVAVSVTGLAGPGGDDRGHEVGTVFIGYSDDPAVFSHEFHFQGTREEIREQTICAALRIILDMNGGIQQTP